MDNNWYFSYNFPKRHSAIHNKLIYIFIYIYIYNNSNPGTLRKLGKVHFHLQSKKNGHISLLRR